VISAPSLAEIQSVELAGFDPGGKRAEAISARMRRRLADSLRYIVDQAGEHLPIPYEELDAFLARLARGPVSPMVFGAYCDLVLAIDANALDEARELLAEIIAAPNSPAGPFIVDLADPASDPEANRYRRLVDTDVDMPFTIAPPPADAASHVRSLIAQAFTLLDRGNSALADEVRIIVREIILAIGSPDPEATQFEGVSSFMLWGAIVLNVDAYKTALDAVQALAHESGHNLLFGLCAHGPLHENGDTERYASPLRIDPRPMDGIVHATYVTARMHQSVQRLTDAGVLDATQTEEARTANIANAQRFAMGMETIDRYARLTPLGRAVMDGADRYMARYL
jgi:HEXXH motif-containing protein